MNGSDTSSHLISEGLVKTVSNCQRWSFYYRNELNLHYGGSSAQAQTLIDTDPLLLKADEEANA